MRRLVIAVAVVIALTGGWYGIWHSMMSGDVARVQASLEHHNQRIKEHNRYLVLKADKVEAAGFPFAFRVVVTRPTLSMIFNRETYAVSLPEVLMEPVDSGQGRYRVTLPATFDALYAIDGSAPENYKVTISPVPQFALRAAGDSTKCSLLPGGPKCEPVGETAPILTYASEMPKTLTLHMELNGQKRDAAFNMFAFQLPVFREIPKEMDGPLEMFIGILREAMVYKTKGN